MKLRIFKPFPGPKGTLPTGDYDVPGQITRTHARCAIADGYATWLPESGQASFRGKGKSKGPAPENKTGSGRTLD
jgi:hypothetical protein